MLFRSAGDGMPLDPRPECREAQGDRRWKHPVEPAAPVDPDRQRLTRQLTEVGRRMLEVPQPLFQRIFHGLIIAAR